MVYVVQITSKQLEVSSFAPNRALDYCKVKGHKELIDHNHLKEPRHVLGIVNNPVWDFVEVKTTYFLSYMWKLK